jgi:glycosyltransferase involved in cell wall biosynthesis
VSGDAPDLSIVIPAFNEEQRLPGAIQAATKYLAITGGSAEVLIVENGSSDRTWEIAAGAASADSRFRALHLEERGKGRAVRAGMLASNGRLAVLCDADFSMPVEEIRLLTDAIEAGADVAVGSREAPGARRVGEPARRHIMGRVFNAVVHLLAVRGLQDTQCGFKAFRQATAQDLFRRQRVNGWAFDVELLYLAQRLGYRISEVPITWRYDASSRVRPVADTISMLQELLTIRWNAIRGHYGQLDVAQYSHKGQG